MSEVGESDHNTSVSVGTFCIGNDCRVSLWLSPIHDVLGSRCENDATRKNREIGLPLRLA